MTHYRHPIYHATLFIFISIFAIWHSPKSSVQATLHQTDQTTTISDGDFDPEDWTLVTDLIGDTTTHTEQRPVVFNPNHTARFTTDTFHAIKDGEFFELYTFHLFDEVYDPAVSGAIEQIDYQEAHILESVSPPHQGQAVYGYLIIEQDGIIYKGSEFPIDYLAWEVQTQTGLRATWFYPHFNPEKGANPDFSAQGSPMRFGYGRYQVRATWYQDVPADQDLIYEHAIDNWKVTLHQSAETPNRAPIAQDDTYIVTSTDDDTITTSLPVLENDSDPDSDQLTGAITQLPDHGHATWQENRGTVFYVRDTTASGNAFPDFFDYQISDGELSDTATVTVLIDCTCALNCINQIAPARQGGAMLDLTLIRRLRDEMMRGTTHGSRYVDMYYQTTPEIARMLILTHTHLGDEAVAVTQLWQDNLVSLVDGDGTAVITQAQVDAIDTFLTNLSDASSPELQQLIADERTRLGSLDNYVGMTMVEAKGQVLGSELTSAYLPLVTQD